MKNKLFLGSIAMMALGAFIILNSCHKDDIKGEVIQLTGVEFKPNYFMLNGAIAGIDADIAVEAMQQEGIDFEMSEHVRFVG